MKIKKIIFLDRAVMMLGGSFALLCMLVCMSCSKNEFVQKPNSQVDDSETFSPILRVGSIGPMEGEPGTKVNIRIHGGKQLNFKKEELTVKLGNQELAIESFGSVNDGNRPLEVVIPKDAKTGKISVSHNGQVLQLGTNCSKEDFIVKATPPPPPPPPYEKPVISSQFFTDKTTFGSTIEIRLGGHFPSGTTKDNFTATMGKEVLISTVFEYTSPDKKSSPVLTVSIPSASAHFYHGGKINVKLNGTLLDYKDPNDHKYIFVYGKEDENIFSFLKEFLSQKNSLAETNGMTLNKTLTKNFANPDDPAFWIRDDKTFETWIDGVTGKRCLKTINMTNCHVVGKLEIPSNILKGGIANGSMEDIRVPGTHLSQISLLYVNNMNIFSCENNSTLDVIIISASFFDSVFADKKTWDKNRSNRKISNYHINGGGVPTLL